MRAREEQVSGSARSYGIAETVGETHVADVRKVHFHRIRLGLDERLCGMAPSSHGHHMSKVDCNDMQVSGHVRV